MFPGHGTGVARHPGAHAVQGRLCRNILLATCLTMIGVAADASSAAGVPWVDRADEMHTTVLADVEQRGDRVRLLYQTMPSMEQSASGNWAINVYLAELYADGRVVNRQLASGQRYFDALSLQRGGDGVFAAVKPVQHDGEHKLEYWSDEDGQVRHSRSLPVLRSAAPGLFPTDDGNFFVITMGARSASREDSNTLELAKFSPAGDELARASWGAVNAVAGPAAGFAVPGGGMGMVVNMHLVKGGRALGGDLDAVRIYDVGGRQIEARVFAETRMLAFGPGGAFAWSSDALERELAWGGEVAIPQTLPINAMMAQNEEQMALMRRVTLEWGGNRDIEHHAVSGYDDIQPTRDGFGMLVDLAADQDLEPAQHGTWFVELGADGVLRREMRITPVADRLDATLERFLPLENGDLLVAGVRRTGDGALHVTRLASTGAIEWTTSPGPASLGLEGLAGTEGAYWAFGQGWNEAANRNQLWAWRVDPAQALAIPPAPEPAAAAPVEDTPMVESAPALDLPEPAEGCTCSCDEFQVFQDAAQQLESASQAEMLATVTSPEYQAMMSCMGGCAMQYMSCRK